MRKFRWSAFLVLSAAIALVAGTAPAAAAVFGLKGGMSVARLHGSLPTDGLIEDSAKLGFGGGAWLAIPRGPRLSIQPELNYVQKGRSLGTIEVTDYAGIPIGSFDVTEEVDYLELPVLLRFSFPGSGFASPYFVGGPVVGFLLSQKLSVSGSVGGSGDIDLFRSTDFGAALGAGLELGRGPFRGTFETRYTLGLPTATKAYTTNARTGAFVITMGLAIRR